MDDDTQQKQKKSNLEKGKKNGVKIKEYDDSLVLDN